MSQNGLSQDVYGSDDDDGDDADDDDDCEQHDGDGDDAVYDDDDEDDHDDGSCIYLELRPWDQRQLQAFSRGLLAPG